MARSIDSLSDDERIAYYRRLALDALDKARNASTDANKAAFLDIAMSWMGIADEVRRVMDREAERAARLSATQTSNNGKRG